MVTIKRYLSKLNNALSHGYRKALKLGKEKEELVRELGVESKRIVFRMRRKKHPIVVNLIHVVNEEIKLIDMTIEFIDKRVDRLSGLSGGRFVEFLSVFEGLRPLVLELRQVDSSEVGALEDNDVEGFNGFVVQEKEVKKGIERILAGKFGLDKRDVEEKDLVGGEEMGVRVGGGRDVVGGEERVGREVVGGLNKVMGRRWALQAAALGSVGVFLLCKEAVASFSEKLLYHDFDFYNKENVGIDWLPFPNICTNINYENIDQVVSRNWEDPLNPITNLPNVEVGRIKEVLQKYHGKILESYHAIKTEILCMRTSHIFHRILEEEGVPANIIEGFVSLGPGNTFPHVYNLLRINDQEFRFDFTADQMTRYGVGLVVSPRIRHLNKMGPLYYNEIIEPKVSNENRRKMFFSEKSWRYVFRK